MELKIVNEQGEIFTHVCMEYEPDVVFYAANSVWGPVSWSNYFVAQHEAIIDQVVNPHTQI